MASPTQSQANRAGEGAASSRALGLRSLIFWAALVAGLVFLIIGPFRDRHTLSLGLALTLTAIGPAAATYRPLGSSTLGLGAALVPVSALTLGPAAAALLAVVAALGSWLLRRRLMTLEDDTPPERRGIPRIVSAGVRAGCATLLSSHLLILYGPNLGGALALGALLLVLALMDAGERFLRAGVRSPLRSVSGPIDRGPSRAPSRVTHWAESGARALAWDGAGFLFGLLFLPVQASAGWVPTLGILAGLGLLSFAAARHHIRASELVRRVAGLESIGVLAGSVGVLSGRSGPGGRRQADMATTILGELRKTVQFSFVQLDIVDPTGELQSWWATDQSDIQRGHADPGETPPPLPGIHRRRPWVRHDRDLIVGDRKLGRFRLWCDPRRETKPDLEVLDHLVPQLAALIERSALDHEARFDSLTGTTRRQVFDEALRRVFAEARMRGSSVSVILCDIDHFKRVNDTYGHAGGDVVLRQVGALLRQDHRDSDLTCRYGGEEFALLLPDTDSRHALATAERIRRRVEEARIEHEGRTLAVTLSAGVASFPELFVEGSEELLMLADRALYAAKEQGRNGALAAIGADSFLTPSGVRVGKEPKTIVAPRL